MLGFVDISQIAHHLEDLFVAAQRDARRLDARAFDLVFSTIDALSLRVEQLARGIGDAPDVSALCRTLVGLAADRARPRRRGGRPPPLRPTPASAPAAQAPAAMRQSLRVPVEKLDGLTHLAPEMVIQSLKASERHVELRRVDTALGRLRDRAREARLAPAAADAPARSSASTPTRSSISTGASASSAVEFSDDRVASEPHHRGVAAARHQPDDAAAARRCSTRSRARYAIWRGSSTRRSR